MTLRERLSPRRFVQGPPPPPPPTPLPPGGGQAQGPPELAERRAALARELAEAQWDLGGLAYEMAIRDHFRLDVLTRQAARLQQLDARLGEVEHLLRLDTTGAAGACPQCGTLYARGALFCSQCAFQLVATAVAGGVAVASAAPQPVPGMAVAPAAAQPTTAAQSSPPSTGNGADPLEPQ